MANTYDIGDAARISAAFTNAAGPVDPTTIVLTVRTPDGAHTTYTYGTDVALVKDSTGNYHVDLAITQVGTVRYRWVSTGTGAAAEEGRFDVRTPSTTL
jgi:hypothetical protein